MSELRPRIERGALDDEICSGELKETDFAENEKGGGAARRFYTRGKFGLWASIVMLVFFSVLGVVSTVLGVADASLWLETAGLLMIALGFLLAPLVSKRHPVVVLGPKGLRIQPAPGAPSQTIAYESVRWVQHQDAKNAFLQLKETKGEQHNKGKGGHRVRLPIAELSWFARMKLIKDLRRRTT